MIRLKKNDKWFAPGTDSSQKQRREASSSSHSTVLTLGMMGGGGEVALDHSQIYNRVCAIL